MGGAVGETCSPVCYMLERFFCGSMSKGVDGTHRTTPFHPVFSTNLRVEVANTLTRYLKVELETLQSLDWSIELSCYLHEDPIITKAYVMQESQ